MKATTNIPVRTRPMLTAVVAAGVLGLLAIGPARAEEPRIKPPEKPMQTSPRPADQPKTTQISPDFDGSGSVDVRDLFAYLTAWFAGKDACDTNRDGLLHVHDLFEFLTLWLTSNGPAMGGQK